MTTKTIAVGNAPGSETHPVAMLVQVASRYDSSIYIENNQRRVNAKSLIGMMSLGLDEGAKILVTADGCDEAAALEAIETYLR